MREYTAATVAIPSVDSPPPARPLRILLVEDSASLAERLAEAIGQMHDVAELAGIADTEADALAAVERAAVDVVLMDLHLKQGTGFGLMRALAARAVRPCIVVLTNYDLPEYKSAAIELGAAYFLDKIRDYDRLPEVLRDLACGAPAAH